MTAFTLVVWMCLMLAVPSALSSPDDNHVMKIKIQFYDADDQELNLHHLAPRLLGEHVSEIPAGSFFQRDSLFQPETFGIMFNGFTSAGLNMSRFSELPIPLGVEQGSPVFAISREQSAGIRNLFVNFTADKYVPYNRRQSFDLTKDTAGLPVGHTVLVPFAIYPCALPPASAYPAGVPIQKGDNVYIEFPEDAISTGVQLSITEIPLRSMPQALNANSFIETFGIAIWPYTTKFERPVKIRLRKLRAMEHGYRLVYPCRLNSETLCVESAGEETGTEPEWLEFTAEQGGIYYGLGTEI